MPTPLPSEFSDEAVLQAARQLQVAYRLKRTLRYSTTRDFSVHSESVAEHVFAMLFLAQYFLPLEDPRGLLDPMKINTIVLFHDFPEIPHGDQPYHLKTKAHEERERAVAAGVFASLPPFIRENAHKSWQEYEAKATPEAQFACALDKIEPLFELLDPVNEKSIKGLSFTYDDHIGKKMAATEGFPYMRRFVTTITADMLARDVFHKA